jgi:glycosyltransferase involved in cell wall biosynthesis
MRVLFVGDLAPTGFGSVTTDLGHELLKLGLDVRFISQNDTGANLPEPFASRTLSMTSLVNVVNTMTGEAGVDTAADMRSIFEDVNRSSLISGEPWGSWRPERVILLGDIQATRYQVAINPDFVSVPALHYVPIEGRWQPPTLKDDLWAMSQPVAMSEFGADEIAKVTGSRPTVVYHGVDTAIFHPVKPSKPITLQPPDAKPWSITSKDECKQAWAQFFNTKLPARPGPVNTDKWMLRTDRHMPRKGYNAMLRALVPVLASNGDAVLICHCSGTDQGGSLPDTIAKLPNAERISGEKGGPESWSLVKRPDAQIIVTNTPGLDRNALATLYNAADLYVSTSAEGFGLTIAEAIACGVPAVGLDYSAVPEVIGPAGVTVPIAYEFDNPYDSFWAAVNEQRFAETVHTLLNDPDQRELLGRKGPRHVYRNFQWADKARQFSDLLHAAPLEAAA